MELILYTLRTVAYAIIGPMNIIMLVVLGVMFYLKNKRIAIIQKMTIGKPKLPFRVNIITDIFRDYGRCYN